MESVANSVQLPPLDNPNERVAVGEELQLVLQDLIDLSLIGKQLHWSVVGAAARGVHLFLDELVEVSPDGGRRDPQLLGQVGRGQRAIRQQ